MSNLRKIDLCYPNEDSYWLLCTSDSKDEVLSYGTITTSQCFVSDAEPIDFYTDREVWKNILEENGIDPDSPFPPDSKKEVLEN